MNSVEDLILQHPLSSKLERTTAEVEEVFPGTANTTRQGQVLLQTFLLDHPQKFFDRDAFSGATDVFDRITQAHADAVPQPLIEEVTEALRFLRLANSTDQDSARKHVGHDDLRAHRLYTEVFARYAHLAEHVLGALLALLVELSAKLLARHCSVSHELRPRWEMACSKKYGLHASLSASYRPTIRNAIIHGGVTLGESKISFKDDNGSVETLSYRQADRLADNILDTCNGISAALVRAYVLDSPLAARLEPWARIEQAISLARTPLFLPNASYLTNHAGTVQAELHGTHSHWRYDHLLLDVARAVVGLKCAFPDANRFFISFRATGGAPCFFSIQASDVPALSDPETALGTLLKSLASGKHGMLWVEHQRLLPKLASSTALGTWLNWIDAVDRSSADMDYELRELRNTSVIG